MQDNEARLNITWQGANGDLPDLMLTDSSDAEVKAAALEAVRTGGVPGIPADPNADFRDFVVDRFPPSEAHPYSKIMLRPKTPFGGQRQHLYVFEQGRYPNNKKIAEREMDSDEAAIAHANTIDATWVWTAEGQQHRTVWLRPQ